MAEENLPDAVELDLTQLLGFRDLTTLGEDADLIAEELDAAHVKIGIEVAPT